MNRMTNRCKNITLLQTSFAGGNNVELLQIAEAHGIKMGQKKKMLDLLTLNLNKCVEMNDKGRLKCG